MKITKIDCQLLHVPTDPPRASPTEQKAGRLNHIVYVVVNVHTDENVTGTGYAYQLQSSGRALLATLEDDLVPLMLEEDPLNHQRLAAKAYARLQSVGRLGLVQQAYSALDLAFWDIKGKVANLPLHKLLGGARDSSPVYASHTGWLWMTVDEILEASEPFLEQGFSGIKVKVGLDPFDDGPRLDRIRNALGEDVWLGADANQRYSYVDALAIGSWLEENVYIDWLEEPISCEDVEGHHRLASKLHVPIACGEMLFSPIEFQQYLNVGAMGIAQPDITRLGGITGFLKVAHLADQAGVPVAPHLQPEVAVHLACGLPQVSIVEYMPWTYPLLNDPPKIENGQMVPPDKPGLGLEWNEQALNRYRK